MKHLTVMDRFLALHAASVNSGALSPVERDEYRFLQGVVFDAILERQNGGLEPGHARRASVRVRAAVQVDLSGESFEARATTFDLGVGGMSALLAEVPGSRAPLLARVRLPRERYVSAEAYVVSARRRQRAAHVSFAFSRRAGDWNRFEHMIVDHVLAELGPDGRAQLNEALARRADRVGPAGVLLGRPERRGAGGATHHGEARARPGDEVA